MSKVLVIAPHPDDETLGVGGTLFRHKDNGDEIFWLIITSMSIDDNFDADLINLRKDEIKKVSRIYKFNDTCQLNFPAAGLDQIPEKKLIQDISLYIDKVSPEIMYIPFGGDAHGDHRKVSSAAKACTKWFRFPSIKKVLEYETLSETDSSLNLSSNSFIPNYYVNITSTIDRKIEALKIYKNEIANFPFPRSEQSLRALASFRGSSSGVKSAESFCLLRQIV